jgi:hypothetical protein
MAMLGFVSYRNGRDFIAAVKPTVPESRMRQQIVAYSRTKTTRKDTRPFPNAKAFEFKIYLARAFQGVILNTN